MPSTDPTLTTSAPRYRFAKRVARTTASAVREILKITERPDVISFAGGMPAPELFPVTAFAAAYQEVFRTAGQKALQYSTTEGHPPLREWICKRMATDGIAADPSRILITSGSQQGIDLVARVLLDPGDSVIVEDPCYLAAIQCFNSYEANLVPVGSDHDGIIIDDVEKAIRRCSPKFIYVVSDFSNPKGVTLSEERRRFLISMARKHRVPIVDDDPYGALRYRGESPAKLAALDDSGMVIYLSTFSKTLSPGTRIGWAFGDEEIIHTLVTAKQPIDLQTATLSQMAAAKLLESFDYDGHIARLRQVYGERCKAMLDAMQQYFPSSARWTRPEGGLFLWVELPEAASAELILEAALKEKVAFVPGAPFFAVEPKHNYMRLNFSNSNPDRIRAGIERLGAILKQEIR